MTLSSTSLDVWSQVACHEEDKVVYESIDQKLSYIFHMMKKNVDAVCM